MRKPDFFLVGAPRCGTTAMHAFLSEHPELFVAAAKELQFFGDDIEYVHTFNNPADRFRVSEAAYLSHFEGAESALRVGEASSLSLASKSAPAEIKRFNPEARIIAMLRQPVDMLHSWHGQLRFTLNEDIEDFGEALAAEPARRRGERIPPTAGLISSLYYREMVRYAEQIERYFSVFGRERVHVVLFDDFVADPGAAYAGTLRFLGVDAEFRPEFRVVNRQTRLRSRGLNQFLARPPRALRPLAQYIAVHQTGLRDAIVRLLHAFNATSEPRTQVESALRKALQAEFAPDIERLGELLGRDLSSWTAR